MIRGPKLSILYGVQDPHKLGACLRSAISEAEFSLVDALRQRSCV